MIRVLARSGTARSVPFMGNLTGFPLVDDDVTPPVSQWWTMTSTHKAWRGGHEIKADVGGGGLQTGREKMAESSHKPVVFDRALQREKARQKRHRQGGKQCELSHRLDQQAEIPLVSPKRKKMPAKETFLKDLAVLHTLGPAGPASPSKEVALMLLSLRPPPSPLSHTAWSSLHHWRTVGPGARVCARAALGRGARREKRQPVGLARHPA